MTDDKPPTSPSMKDFDYFANDAKPVKNLNMELPESLEEQMDRYKAQRAKGARSVLFATLFFGVCGWFLWATAISSATSSPRPKSPSWSAM